MIGLLLLMIAIQGDTITTSSQNIDEVVVVTRGQGGKRSAKGQLATIDEHLKELNNVDLVRRGSYAWEPMVNNMSSERLSITIDGMKIFYACTDKMDPVTSYVESDNLKSITLNSGLNGNPQATGNIGGSLDLKLRKAGFLSSGLSLYDSNAKTNSVFTSTLSAGFEANGNVQAYGGDVAYSSLRFYANGGVFYRHADNYKAGGNRKIDFSQYQKVNAFVNNGYRLSDNDMLEGTFIFDRATDVGYPALNMDVSKAEAFITSLAYKHLFHERTSGLSAWETKAYYNHITHIMDDTTRPDVQIHMDMPGDSWTAGAYTLLTGSFGRHNTQFNIDGYYNRLFADMTMYPGGAAPMYMVTWPDVGTLNIGASFSDDICLTENAIIHLSGKLSSQYQRLNSDEGYKSLNIFFPGLRRQYRQVTGRMAASYQLSLQRSSFTVGIGWGSRAPTVTEAYGYYLNNTYDQYDYIGNPRMKNESAFEANTSYKVSLSTVQLGIEANAFFLSNYIIGQFENRLSAMTVGAEGVKVYGNISHATVANVSLNAEWKPVREFSWNVKGTYSLGRDDEGYTLPLISPLSYRSRMKLSLGSLNVLAELTGNARQVKYGRKYGETSAGAWTIVNLSATHTLTLLSAQTILRVGIENLFDKYYSSFSDWCHIPQKGRNIYANISLQL